MGGGFYSSTARDDSGRTKAYVSSSVHETFKQRNINNAMNPEGIVVRESRDSEEHPNTVPVILALDVTGSMGSVPAHLIKTGLPTMMDSILTAGVEDPQLLFLAIGDHECDRSPLQVGQFESSDELLDHWLTTVYLEGGGGANRGESYLLAWFFAARYTETDAWSKRGEKGCLFTIGDELCLPMLPAQDQESIMGPGQYSHMTAVELLEQAREKWNVIHIHVRETGAGRNNYTVEEWRRMMGDDLYVVQTHKDIPELIAQIVAEEAEMVDTDNPTVGSENPSLCGNTPTEML